MKYKQRSNKREKLKQQAHETHINELLNGLTYQPTDKSVNQPDNQPINKPTTQPASQPTNYSTDQLFHIQPTYNKHI